MDYTALSSWHSAPCGEPFPLAGACTFINGLEVEVYTNREDFFFLVSMPSEPLRFRGVFKDRQGHQFVLQDQERFYWRPLTEQEKEIIQLWWRNLPERQNYPDGRLIQIQDYLKSGSPEVVITFDTKYGRQVQAWRHHWLILKEEKWHSIDERHLMASLAEQGVRFWVHNQNEPISGAGMSLRMFLLYITPTQRRASHG